MTIFIYRGFVVSRFEEILSSAAVHVHLSQLADYYGSDDDSDITVIQY